MADAPDAAGRTFRGVAAAPGLAVGPAFLLPASGPQGTRRQAGAPAEETAALDAALARAGAALAALAGSGDALAAEILAFQSALLEDEDLLAPVRRAIAAGRPATAAWAGHLDAEIADYAAAGDAYMAARAADLADLRDRVAAALGGGDAGPVAPPEGAVIVACDLGPSAFLGLDWGRLGGAALRGGSATSHVAILARARGVPMLVGLDPAAAPRPGETVLLDADAGWLALSPSPAAIADAGRRRTAAEAARAADAAAALRPAATASGRSVRVLVNVDDPAALDGLDPAICDGVGLMRSEFLFAKGAPDEEAQRAAYARVLAWAGGRPVTIRTLDAGGDKPVPGVTLDEANPFLGTRGIRLSLARPDLFRIQLRALARAAASGPLKVMLPMVTAPAELEAARAHLDAAEAELAAEGLAHARPPLGIMVETPAAALVAERFDAAFYSIGSNDLVQYTTAAARDLPGLASVADPDHAAVAELIARTVAAGRARGVEVSLCGDLASQPGRIARLLGLGLDTLSVAPACVGAVKRAIAAAP